MNFGPKHQHLGEAMACDASNLRRELALIRCDMRLSRDTLLLLERHLPMCGDANCPSSAKSMAVSIRPGVV